ncbi:hypothetical protein V9T40_014795 [Parthenolecanium corni]|uniref:Uncharacterized protein n=1 Tax=Parthenolecanium corni TaxID=536013 RepID=A0AAN9XY05_9HEMI
MHTVGLHSALAIKRQRKRREEMRKARERRFSSQSTESGLGGSRSSCNSPGSLGGSTDRLRASRRKHKAAGGASLTDTNVVSNIGMLHIGIVLLVLGLFLVGSGLVPDDYTTWGASINWWNQLLLSGITVMIIGVFLIVLNHYLSQREEDELSRYVEHQLTRSRSGKRLIKDEETGCLTTKHEKRARESAATVETEVHASGAGGAAAAAAAYPELKSPPGVSSSTPKSDLERILEEEASEERADADGEAAESFRMEVLEGKSATLVDNGGCYVPSSRKVLQFSAEPRELVVTRYYNTHH